MTEQINKTNQKNKHSFIQLIIPVLLAFTVFLLSVIAWFGQTNYVEAKGDRKTQQQINLQVLENLGTLNANCNDNTTDVDDLKINDRKQDLMLQVHETKLKLIR